MKKQHPILGSVAKPLAWHRVRLVRGAWLLAALLSPLALGACGQKGPLYLPAPAQAAPSSPHATSP